MVFFLRKLVFLLAKKPKGAKNRGEGEGKYPTFQGAIMEGVIKSHLKVGYSRVGLLEVWNNRS